MKKLILGLTLLTSMIAQADIENLSNLPGSYEYKAAFYTKTIKLDMGLESFSSESKGRLSESKAYGPIAVSYEKNIKGLEYLDIYGAGKKVIKFHKAEGEWKPTGGCKKITKFLGRLCVEA